MVHHVMIAMSRDNPNVDTFETWCEDRGLTSELVDGCRVTSLADVKDCLTPYGYYMMHNWKESSCQFDQLSVIGCFLSHRKAWQICVDRLEPVWIFEEGVSSYDTHMFETIDAEYGTYDLVLGHTMPVLRILWQTSVNKRSLNRHLESIDKIYYGAKCYRISPVFAQQLLDNSHRFDTHVDIYMCNMAMYYDTSYLLARTKNPIVSAWSSSCIKHTIESMLLMVIILLLLAMGLGLSAIFLAFAYRKCRRTCSR